MTEREQRTAIRDFLNSLPLIHAEAHRIGLYATGQVLHEAVRKAGYEAAEVLAKLDKKEPAS